MEILPIHSTAVSSVNNFTATLLRHLHSVYFGFMQKDSLVSREALQQRRLLFLYVAIEKVVFLTSKVVFFNLV